MPSNHAPQETGRPDHGSRKTYALVIVLAFVIALVLLGYPLPTAVAAAATAATIAAEVAHLLDDHLRRGRTWGRGARGR